jgi:hypothetical protein
MDLLFYASREVCAGLLSRLDRAALAEAVAGAQVPISLHLAEAIIQSEDPVLCAALAAHVRGAFPDAPLDEVWEDQEWAAPPRPPRRYERELPLVWPQPLLRRLAGVVPDLAEWVEWAAAPRPWRGEWSEGWDIDREGPTGVPAFVGLPDGVHLPWPPDVLAAAWTDLLAYPEGRRLSLPDVVLVLHRGVIAGVFTAGQAVREVRPGWLASSWPHWCGAAWTNGRLRSMLRYRYRLIHSSVEGRLALGEGDDTLVAEGDAAIQTGLLVRRGLGGDVERWSAAARLLSEGFAGTLPELVVATA